MILFELTGNEQHPAYQSLQISNGERHYSFLESIVAASIAMERPFLSQTVLKAINFHAIACLHTNAGEFRPCEVKVGQHMPPAYHRVPALMDDLVNMVNRMWSGTDPVVLATYVLWRLNHIHPFINGNGRTARAASYYILCVKSGGWIAGDTILPELLKANRPEYVEALRKVDASTLSGTLDLAPLHSLLQQLIGEQMKST